MEQLRAGLPSGDKVAGLELVALDFDKDDDGHIEYVTACSNLRACNYKITPTDKLNTKLVAGKIMPAIATTTSMVAGLVCLELYKLVQVPVLPALCFGFVLFFARGCTLFRTLFAHCGHPGDRRETVYSLGARALGRWACLKMSAVRVLLQCWESAGRGPSREREASPMRAARVRPF